MANVVDSLEDVVREELSPGIDESLPDTSGVFRDIRGTSMGVNRRDSIGRDFYVKHNFTASLAGAFQWKSSSYGSAVNAYVAPPVVWGTPQAFPSSTESANMGVVQRELQLVQGSGNFFLPIQLFQLDQLDAATIKYVGENIRQCAKLVAHMYALSFFAVAPSSTTLKPLAVCPADGDGLTEGGTSEYVVTIDISDLSNYSIRNFYPGMPVDILDSSNSYASLLDSNDVCFVTEVDYLNQTVTMALSTESYGFEAQVDEDDVIVAKGTASTSTGYGPSGLESWIKAFSSGVTVNVFGIPVSHASSTQYPQFGSLVADVSDSLTESILNKYVGSFYDAYGKKLDTFITRGGVVREMLDQVEDLGMFSRQGQALKFEGGWGDIGYQYNGQSFRWLLDNYVYHGYLYGLMLGGGNLSRYTPPRVPGTGTHSAFDGEIQFIANWAGSSGIFKSLHNSSGATTELVEAPYMTLCEIAPRDVQSIKLTGLTELNA